MISKESQKIQLARGIAYSTEEMACQYGIRGHLVACVFGKYCHTGSKRIRDLRLEYEGYLLSDKVANDPNSKYINFEPAYEYNHATKRYVLDKLFYHWLKNNYLKGAKNEEGVL